MRNSERSTVAQISSREQGLVDQDATTDVEQARGIQHAALKTAGGAWIFDAKTKANRFCVIV